MAEFVPFASNPFAQPQAPPLASLPPELIAAQDAAEAAAARVRAPYAKANERSSGLPDIINYFGNRLANVLTAPRDALTGSMQVTDPETGMPTREAMERGQAVANLAMTGGVPFARQGTAGMAGGRLAQPVEEYKNALPTKKLGGKRGTDQGDIVLPAAEAGGLPTLQDAYRAAESEAGMKGAVPIKDLIERSGLSKEQVHDLLLNAAQENKVALHFSNSRSKELDPFGIRVPGFKEAFSTVTFK